MSTEQNKNTLHPIQEAARLLRQIPRFPAPIEQFMLDGDDSFQSDMSAALALDLDRDAPIYLALRERDDRVVVIRASNGWLIGIGRHDFEMRDGSIRKAMQLVHLQPDCRPDVWPPAGYSPSLVATAVDSLFQRRVLPDGAA